MAHERIFDYPFDFQEYVEKSLREFENDEERKFAKAVLQDGLLNIIKANEARYQRLESRVLNEIENESGKYVIRTTIIKREDYDPINTTLFPILDSDRNFLKVMENEPWSKIKEKLPCVTVVIYIEATDAVCAEINEKEERLQGKIITDQGPVSAQFLLKKSTLHKKEIADMYERFCQNHVPWNTINTAFLDHFFEIQLIEIEGEMLDESCIKGIDIDYGIYQEYMQENIMPLWNVQKIFYNGSDFPMPCIDSVNYEHEFPMKAFGIFNGFLIEKNTEIVDIRFEISKIVVVTPRETFNKWLAYRIVSDTPSRSLGYMNPIISNEKKSSFIKNYMEQNGASLQTKSDLVRRINELEIEDYIHFHSHEILENNAPLPYLDNMNWFIQNELLDLRSRRILLLKFKARNPGNYLNDAMVRFAVSTVQMDFSEYRCIGCLVE